MSEVRESQKLKVVTFVGTRPEIIRLSRVIPLLDEHCDHVLVHTGQNYDYELNGIFFSDLSIRKPDKFLEAAGATSAETIGNVIARADQLLRDERPQAVLILGDTNSCLAFPFSTWKPEIAALTSGFPRRPTARSSITPRTSISPTARSRARTC
jgi:UDP-N-acetylglucosamine 2-epimerase